MVVSKMSMSLYSVVIDAKIVFWMEVYIEVQLVGEAWVSMDMLVYHRDAKVSTPVQTRYVEYLTKSKT